MTGLTMIPARKSEWIELDMDLYAIQWVGWNAEEIQKFLGTDFHTTRERKHSLATAQQYNQSGVLYERGSCGAGWRHIPWGDYIIVTGLGTEFMTQTQMQAGKFRVAYMKEKS